MKTITLNQLREHGACEEQVELFEETFGESVDITVELCESVALDFDFNWAAHYLLTPAARAEYECVAVAARAEYERVKARAWAEYERVAAPVLAEYERVEARAWAEYERVAAPVLAEYERVKARAFAELYLNQEEPKS